MANSVLSPANRLFRAEQAKRAADSKDRAKRRIVIAGQAFSVDEEDLSVTQVDENERPSPSARVEPTTVHDEVDDVVAELGCKEESAVYRRLSGGPKRAPPLGLLHKQDSLASVTSSCSVESDWSDEEIEELEKIFDHIQVFDLIT